MKKLKALLNELPVLVENNIIDSVTAARIKQFYADQPSGSSRLLVAAFGIIGSLLIGGGIILLLAHNWEELSRPLRSLIAVAPLVAAIALAYRTLTTHDTSAAWREGVSIFYFLSIGAAISLISQTYHISGDFSRFLLVWALLALPIGYILRSGSLFFLYLIVILFWGISSREEHDSARLYWILFAGVLPYYWYLLHERFDSLQFTFISWSGVISFLIAMVIALDISDSGIWLIIYGSVLSAIYILGRSVTFQTKQLASNPFVAIPLTVIPVISLILTFDHAADSLYENHSLAYNTTVNAEGIAAALAVAAASFALFRGLRRGIRIVPAGLFVIACLIAYAIVRINGSAGVIMLLFNLYLLLYGIVEIVRGVQLDSLPRLNYGMLITGALITARFFDTDLSFVFRGIVFILLGALFLAVNYHMLRRSDAK